jgi:hypothetical protein
LYAPSRIGRINDTRIADAIIKSGKADMVAFGRQSIADPETPNKAKEGRFTDIRTCVGCLHGCDANVNLEKSGTCELNPIIGHESEAEYQTVFTSEPKNVMVIGAGPGGLETAIGAAKCGHHVTVYDKERWPGGKYRLASVPPCKGELAAFVVWQMHELKKLNVPVIMETAVTRELVDAVKPDVIRAFTLVLFLSIAVNSGFYVICRSIGPEAAAKSMHFGSLFFIFMASAVIQGIHYGFCNLLVPSVIEYGYKRSDYTNYETLYALLLKMNERPLCAQLSGNNPAVRSLEVSAEEYIHTVVYTQADVFQRAEDSNHQVVISAIANEPGRKIAISGNDELGLSFSDFTCANNDTKMPLDAQADVRNIYITAAEVLKSEGVKSRNATVSFFSEIAPWKLYTMLSVSPYEQVKNTTAFDSAAFAELEEELKASKNLSGGLWHSRGIENEEESTAECVEDETYITGKDLEGNSVENLYEDSGENSSEVLAEGSGKDLAENPGENAVNNEEKEKDSTTEYVEDETDFTGKDLEENSVENLYEDWGENSSEVLAEDSGKDLAENTDEDAVETEEKEENSTADSAADCTENVTANVQPPETADNKEHEAEDIGPGYRYITLTENGKIKQTELAQVCRQENRKTMGVDGVKLKSGDRLRFVGMTDQDSGEWFIFTSNGKFYIKDSNSLQCYNRNTEGVKAKYWFADYKDIAAIISFEKLEAANTVFIVTEGGEVKRLKTESLIKMANRQKRKNAQSETSREKAQNAGGQMIRLKAGDRVTAVIPEAGENNIMLISRCGKIQNTSVNAFRVINSLNAAGVAGMKTDSGDTLCSAAVIMEGGRYLLCTADGKAGIFGSKVTAISANTKGEIGGRKGLKILAVVPAIDGNELVLAADNGKMVRIGIDRIPEHMAATMKLKEGSAVIAAYAVNTKNERRK